MTGIREKKREALKRNLVSSASDLIIAGGVNQLRARDVTEKAGCALGSLYTIFEDLDHLVMQVNVETLEDLGKKLDRYSNKQETADGMLIALSRGYLAYASKNTNLWNALFYRIAPEDMPDWYIDKQRILLEKIAEPLSLLFPDLNEDDLMLRSRTFFSAVHGIVSFGLLEPYIAVPRSELEIQLTHFVERAVRGYLES